MNELDVTVLIPTHDHGPLLQLAIESALAQTVPSLEVLVVGDGAREETRDLVAGMSAHDGRVRYFDNPKGPRHGELHRHAALSEARGSAVLYLSDDDLWLPYHAEVMLGLLAEADIACAMCVKVYPDGMLATRRNDLAKRGPRARLLGGGPGIPLSCAGHTLAAYRNLPFGWRTTPEGIATDKYMWQQFLNDPACQAAGSKRLTVLSFGSPVRTHMSARERLDEMQGWWKRLREPPEPASLDIALFRTLEELADAKALIRELNAKIARRQKIKRKKENAKRRASRAAEED
jgi:GalNAc5-diNAcBac-PP-undecaprenol beta-1,3-glucosyltransferase